ncbi:hypothetical protein EDD85DRAFT_797789 [Armillaria nabsnona]|nr:hypothetical protein EDD85DRAFT_797789 [Armillaria nabsnona]
MGDAKVQGVCMNWLAREGKMLDGDGQHRALWCVSKGVILQNVIPYTLAMQRHGEWADSASGTQRSKVTEVESSIMEKEAIELKHKDFVGALYLTGMHGHKAEGSGKMISRAGLGNRSIAWLPGLEYDVVTFGADPKAEYKV